MDGVFRYEVYVPAVYAVAIVSNGLIGSKGIAGNTVADVSDLYRTAITPAGYAFSIWGPIYMAGTGFAWYCATNPAFAGRVGPAMTANLALNAVWIPLWCAEQRWPAIAVIWAMLGTANSVWLEVGAPSGPAASFAEWLSVRPFTSLYTSWLMVACTVATASTLTTRNKPNQPLLGLSPSSWARAVLPAVAAITSGLGWLRNDATVPAVAAWALFAIATKQRDDSRYPGDAGVASLARGLAWGCAAVSAGVLALAVSSGEPWWSTSS